MKELAAAFAFAATIVGALAALLHCSSSPPPVIDPAALLAQTKAACAALEAIPAPLPPPATGGTGGYITVGVEPTGGAP